MNLNLDPNMGWLQESLVDLNKRLNAPLPMNRFRANIVVAGGSLPVDPLGGCRSRWWT